MKILNRLIVGGAVSLVLTGVEAVEGKDFVVGCGGGAAKVAVSGNGWCTEMAATLLKHRRNVPRFLDVVARAP